MLPVWLWIASASAQTGYVGVNLLAPFTQMDNVAGRYLLPFFSDMELGPAISGGILLGERGAVEARLSLGTPERHTWLGQARLGGVWYLAGEGAGPHLGGAVRWWTDRNAVAHTAYTSLLPELSVGWRFGGAPWYVDPRLGWIFGAVTWSNVEHTSVGAAFDPFFPMLGVDVGRSFGRDR